MRWFCVTTLTILVLPWVSGLVLAQGQQAKPPVVDRVELIFKDLKSDSAVTKKAALGGAAQLFQELRGMAQLVPKLLEDPDEDVRYEAAKALEELGPLAGAEPDHGIFKPTAVLLGKALFDKSPKVRVKAFDALGQMGKLAAPAVPDIIKALKSEDVVIRRRAASLLGVIGPGAEKAVPDLIKALDDPDPWINNPKVVSVPHAAMMTLGWIGPKAKAAIPVLMKRLLDKNQDSMVRGTAVVSLAKIGKDEPQVQKSLIAILEDPNEHELHHAAAHGLMLIGPAAKAGVPALVKLLDLKKIGKYKDPQHTMEQFIGTLGVMGPEAKAAVSHLANLVQDKSLPSSVRHQCIWALTAIGPSAKEALPVLMVPYLDPKSGIDLARVNEAFLKIGGADAKPYLLKALKAERYFARLYAAEALAQLGRTDPEIIKALEQAAQNDPETGVRRAANDALDVLLKRPKSDKLLPP